MERNKLTSQDEKKQIIELMRENENLQREIEKIEKRNQALRYQYQHIQDYSIPGEEVKEQTEIMKENGIENQQNLDKIKRKIDENNKKINKLMKLYKQLKDLEKNLGSKNEAGKSKKGIPKKSNNDGRD